MREFMSTEKKLVAFIFAVALTVRIGAFIFLGPSNWDFGDADAYRNLAQNLASGKGFQITLLVRGLSFDWWNDPADSWYIVGRSGQPTSFYEPVFPLVLAAFYKIFGSIGDSAFIALQIIFGSWISVLIFFLGKRIASQAGALAAGLFAAIYPSFVFYSIVLMTDMLFFLLLILTILQGFRYAERPSLFNLVIVAVLIAVTALTRSVAIVVVPVILAAVLISRRSWLSRMGRAAVFAGIVGLFLGAWMARNYVVFREPLLLPTKGAYNLWDTMACLPRFISDKEKTANFREQLSRRWDISKVQALYPNLQRVDLLFLPDQWAPMEPQRARQLTQRSLEFITNNLLFSFKRYLKVAAKMYLPFMIETESRALQWGQSVAQIIAFFMGIWGWLRCRSKYPILDIIAAALILYGLIVPIYSLQNSQRSRMPFDIMFVWLAACSFQAIYERVFAKKATQ